MSQNGTGKGRSPFPPYVFLNHISLMTRAIVPILFYIGLEMIQEVPLPEDRSMISNPRSFLSNLLSIALITMLMVPVGPTLIYTGTAGAEDAGGDVSNPVLYGNITRFPRNTTALDLEASRFPAALDFDVPLGSEVSEASVKAKAILPYQPVNYEVGTDPQAVETGDFNRDGWPDLVTADKSSGDDAGGQDTVSILLNDKVGGLSGGGKAQTYQVGDGPVDLAVGDVTMDGWPDVVTADENDDTLTILPNSPTQALDQAKKVVLDVDGTPRTVVIAQLDGAPGNDVAVAVKKTITEYNETTGNYTFIDVVQLLTFNNDGKGVLKETPKARSLENLSISDMGVGDMDRDGDMDIIVASTTPPFKVLVLRNDGKGSFPTTWTATLPGPPGAMAIGDLDGDGGPDVAVVTQEGPLTILLNKGGGTLDRKDYTMAADRTNLGLSDIDNDGDLDVLVVDRAQNTVTFMLNDGKGGLVYDTFFFIGYNPTDVISLDVDRDGDQDIATCNIGDETVSLMQNSGMGTFQWYTSYYIKATGEITLGDFNKDGTEDVLSTNYQDHSITVDWNKGNGAFSREDVDWYPGYKVMGAGGVGGSEPFFPTTGDFDNDGDLDAIYGEELSNSIILLNNDGTGKFTQTSAANDKNGVPLLPAPPFQTMANDIDGDGDLDLISNFINHPYLAILLGDGKGTFPVWLNQTTGGHYVYDYIMRDLDGDGDKDLVTCNYGNGTFYEESISFLRNDGGGRFTFVGDFKVDKAPRALEMSDVTGDGKEDIILTHSFKPDSIADIKPSYISVLTTKTLDIREGNVKLDFSISKYDAGLLPGHVRAVDIENDGDMDLYVLNMGIGRGSTLSVFINDGTGKFATPAIEYTGFPDKFHLFTDFDGDGRKEMVLPTLMDHFTVFWNLYYPGDLNFSVASGGVDVDTMAARSGVVVNLTGAINAYLVSKRAADGLINPNASIDVPLSVRTTQRGIVRLTDLRITYRPVTSTPPTVSPGDNGTGPDDFTFDLRDGRTQILLFLVGLAIVASLTVGAPSKSGKAEKVATKGRKAEVGKAGKKEKGKHIAKDKRK